MRLCHRAGLAAAALILAACERGGPHPGKFDGESALRYAKAQLDFGTRIPGTTGAQKAGDWIIARKRERADSVIVQSWTQTLSDGQQLPLRNILARFRPNLPDRVLYVTHWDTRPVSDQAEDPAQRRLPMPGANDGASGVAVLLELARSQQIHVGHSTPSVEFWLLLHFRFTTGPLLSSRAAEQAVAAAWGQPYDKRQETFQRLWPAIEPGIPAAVSRALQVREYHQKGGAVFPANPSTELDLLVRALNAAVSPPMRILG